MAGEQALTSQEAPVQAPPPEQIESDEARGAVVDDEAEENALAGQRGWVDKKDWHGKGAWVPAKEFNERYEQVMPVVRRENKTLQTQLAQERQAREAMAAELAELKKAQEETQTARAEVRIQILEQERASALQAGDHQEFTRLDRELRKLERETGGAAPRAQPQPAPVNGAVPETVKAAISEFTARYPIFNTDADLQRELGVEVDALQRVSRAAGQVPDPVAILEQAARRVARNNPQAFPNPRSKPAMAEGRTTPARGNQNEKTWDNLNDESRDYFDELMRRNKTVKKETLLAQATPQMFRK